MMSPQNTPLTPEQLRRAKISSRIVLLALIVTIITVLTSGMQYFMNATDLPFAAVGFALLFLLHFIAFQLLYVLGKYLWGFLRVSVRALGAAVRYFRWLFTHHRIAAWSFLGLLLLFLVIGGIAGRARETGRITDTLAVIQDSLTEAAAAKLMGDSIMVRKPTPHASMTKVSDTAIDVADRLSLLDVPEVLQDYQRVAIIWVGKIAAAANNTAVWKKLDDQPGDFQLNIGNSQAASFLRTSQQHLADLKEFEQSAIARHDRDGMRFVAGKVLIERHWLEGLMYSRRSSLLSFHLVETAFAITANDVRGLGFSTCQQCQEVLQALRSMPGAGQQAAALAVQCSNICSLQIPDRHTPDVVTPPSVPARRSTPSVPVTTTQVVAPMMTMLGRETHLLQSAFAGARGRLSTVFGSRPRPIRQTAPYHYDNAARRKVCNGSYCAEPAWQSTTEELAADVEFIQGGEETTLLGGAGITQGEPIVESKLPPRAQALHDDCISRNGTFGGSIVMSRLPTTEDGYHCRYGNGCWDFLTYSGGHYMGGNPGCSELNLVPRPNPAPAPSTLQRVFGVDDDYVSLNHDTSLRLGPGASFPIRLTLKADWEVKVLSFTDDHVWAYVQTRSGKTGYVLAKTLGED